MKQLRSEAADYRKEAAELSRTAVSRQRANFALNAGNQLMLRGRYCGTRFRAIRSRLPPIRRLPKRTLSLRLHMNARAARTKRRQNAPRQQKLGKAQ